jgi:predicted kinase
MSENPLRIKEWPMQVEILVGMIASGKSTYARARAAQGAIIINDDDLVMAVHGGNYLLYDKALKPLYKTLETTLFGLAVAAGRDVVVDRGVNISRAGRARWVAMAKSYDIPCRAVVFPHDGAYVHAERRYKNDARGYTLEDWVKVAQSHDARYEVPTPSEGYEWIYYTPDCGGGVC